MKKAVIGFSLLELLVVVALIAAIAAFTVPNLFGRNQGKELQQHGNQIGDLFRNASDFSLFRGQLLAVELQSRSLTPLIFDIETATFIEPADEALVPIELPETLSLSWELQQLDSQTNTLSQSVDGAITKQQQTESETPSSQRDQKQQYQPQLFFFPSGEVTPVTLTLEHKDFDSYQQLSVDVLGRVRDPEENPEQDLMDE